MMDVTTAQEVGTNTISSISPVQSVMKTPFFFFRLFLFCFVSKRFLTAVVIHILTRDRGQSEP